jgi:hypothetical protein
VYNPYDGWGLVPVAICGSWRRRLRRWKQLDLDIPVGVTLRCAAFLTSAMVIILAWIIILRLVKVARR